MKMHNTVLTVNTERFSTSINQDGDLERSK